MSLTKTEEEITILREAGKRLSSVLDEVCSNVAPGITTKELDHIAEQLIRKGGDTPAFLNYTPQGAPTPFPGTLCTSVNEEVVHGIPSDRTLKEGDIIGLDIGLIHKGLFVDMARTLPVGSISKEEEELISITRKSLHKGIEAARIGSRIGAIGEAIEAFIKPYGYGVVRDLGGHGVGHAVHEPPFIPNFGNKDDGPAIVEGMVLALEPMITLGTDDVDILADGYTIVTKDTSRSAHFEHTIAVTKKGPIILTQ